MSDFDESLVPFGYAPGNYWCRCKGCDNTFSGDKRARRCEACARKAKVEHEAKPPPEKPKSDGRGDTALARRLFLHMKDGGTLNLRDIERMVRALEHRDQRIADMELRLEQVITAKAEPGEIRNLVERLYGRYDIGPHLPNGKPEFGIRQFETTPINKEAAAMIVRLQENRKP